MALSVFDLFKIGIGPSSSHTVGPMIAAARFARKLPDTVTKVTCTLYGSLGATGIGHGTDKAVILGLMGEDPAHVDPIEADDAVARVRKNQRLALATAAGTSPIDFTPATDIVLVGRTELPGHPNGMTFVAWQGTDQLLAETYYSVGGGFVVNAEDADKEVAPTHSLPYPFTTGAQLLEICEATGMSIAEVALENELAMRTRADISSGLADIWQVMEECVCNGYTREGILPGGLNVLRRAPGMHASLKAESSGTDPLRAMDWITLYALAVNEENAGGGRVVTAPTNGAAGIIPAVMHYCRDFLPDFGPAAVEKFLLTAGAIGMIFKTMASISGAEVGCQGEVGSACSMAAAGLAAVLGGTPQQVENAAEIAMEHNLGLTCDPIGGLVQIPCIERNAIAAIKAVAAARTAMRGDGSHMVSLDDVITTMRETGRDMQAKYKETALGGLAVHVGLGVNVVEC
ncbi:L-serine ammonia-lyase [Trueperella bialowiezensis]|uniref:L-serine dehydratase n=1 Tax=Trueperella bialowiezensis TaxID=312285 RepID=A0A3S4Z447_9ACTO|nr:L-serine ammonia-lyase [Trueperella bialowiezensis]VEI12491.1 L-serine dehydratase tdcG [Trueperella bialowiezensis]